MKKSILIPFLFMGLLAFASCKGTSENKSTTAQIRYKPKSHNRAPFT